MKTKQEILDHLYDQGRKLLENIEHFEMYGDWELAQLTRGTLDLVISKIERLENGNIHKS